MESTDRLHARLFGSDAMRAVFSDRARLQGMLDFEAALADAAASAGLISVEIAQSIRDACDADDFDIDTLAREAARAGNTAIPLVRRLTGRIASAEAAGYVHFGATSQDAMDTGLVLQIRRALDILENDLTEAADAAAVLAQRHKHTIMAGRTWLQQAVPTTFGVRAAGWLSALERHRVRLQALRAEILTLQFGGAAGTLASLGSQGLPIARALAKGLKLTLPDIPWHTHRDRIAVVASALAILTGTLGKIAREVSLLMQTEIGEVSEPEATGGGSSSMPHKRNPVRSSAILAASARAPGLVSTVLSAMPQEHERGLGNWPAEWDALPELFRIAAGALQQTVIVLSGLNVDEARMRANLEATGGQIMAEAVKTKLAQTMGAQPAHAIVERACRTASSRALHLRDVLANDPEIEARLEPGDLERFFDPSECLGACAEFVEAVLTTRLDHR